MLNKGQKDGFGQEHPKTRGTTVVPKKRRNFRIFSDLDEKDAGGLSPARGQSGFNVAEKEYLLEKSTSCNPHLQLEEGEELVIINYRLLKRKKEND